MTPLRTLIVDDEPIARQVLREELELFPEVQIAGEAADGDEALRQIRALKPQLVFLDLQMPVMGGFEVVNSITGPQLPVIVIVTAFDQHAIRAFEAGALDYLLKPVSAERLRKAVDRALALSAKPAEAAHQLERIAQTADPTPNSHGRKIVGRSGADYVLLDLDEVLAFQAERELVWIVTARQRLLATQPLRAIEERLDAARFQRVHRSAIVNVDHVRKMTPLSSQRWLITLSNQQQLIVSKRLAASIRGVLKW